MLVAVSAGTLSHSMDNQNDDFVDDNIIKMKSSLIQTFDMDVEKTIMKDVDIPIAIPSESPVKYSMLGC